MMKTRTDAWSSGLTDEQTWTAYITTRSMAWTDAVRWIADEYHIPAPSRSAFYRFQARMRADDATLRLQRAAASVTEAGALAEQVGVNDEVLVNAYKTLAADAIMTSGDTEQAQRLVNMALGITDRARQQAELELKRRTQDNRDDQLELAKKKFEAAEKRANAAKTTLTNKALTPKEREARLKEIFGL